VTWKSSSMRTEGDPSAGTVEGGAVLDRQREESRGTLNWNPDQGTDRPSTVWLEIPPRIIFRLPLLCDSRFPRLRGASRV
jgi:hypothetical protein